MRPVSEHQYYVWEVPGKPVVFRLALNVVDTVAVAVLAGFKAVPRRGLEVGGLLLGSAQTDSTGQSIVTVTGVELFESEHRLGPSYTFSEADRKRLREKLKKQDRVVGIFRSHTRKG